MEISDLEEITRVICDEHAQDVGRWMGEYPGNSVLGVILGNYADAQYAVLRDMRRYIEDGVIPDRRVTAKTIGEALEDIGGPA